MLRIKSLLILFCLITLIVSCDRPVCENKNPIFDKYLPDAKPYKDELVRQLAKVDKSKLTYWMDNYQEDNVAKYINVHIQGDGLCAKVKLRIVDSEKGIEGILEKKGVSYQGAELENLKFDSKHDSISTEFVFKEVSGIND